MSGKQIGDGQMEKGIVKQAVLVFMICALAAVIFGLRYYERQAAGESVADETAYGETAPENKDVYSEIGIRLPGNWQQKIMLYPDGEKLYAFLPAGADRSNLHWSFDENKYEVTCAGRGIRNNARVAVFDGEETVQIRERNEDELTSYRLCVLQSENIPAIFINTESGSMDWIHREKGNRESGTFASLNENGEPVYEGPLEKITGRGNSSWAEDKKSYTITLSEKAELAGMPAAEKWVLQANAMDATRMRNKLTYDLARDMGLRYAVDSAYADVWLNGEYVGNYLLCEKIEAGKERVDISAEDASEETDGYVREEDGAWWEYVGAQDRRDGYLLEFNERIGEEETGYFYAAGRQVEIKTPKQPTREEYAYIRDYARKLTESTENAANSDSYLEYLDLESWSRLFLINELSNDTDANRYSVFYYKDKGTKLYAGPIWDYDIAWGNDTLGKDVHCSFFRNGWYGTLYDNPIFYQSITEHYRGMRQILERYLNESIDILCDRIGSSIRMDDIRWAHSGGYTRRSDVRQWEDALACLRDYMRERMEYFNGVWLSGETYHRVFFYSGDTVAAVTYVKEGDTVPGETLDYVAKCLEITDWHTQDNEVYDRTERVYSDLRLYV